MIDLGDLKRLWRWAFLLLPTLSCAQPCVPAAVDARHGPDKYRLVLQHRPDGQIRQITRLDGRDTSYTIHVHYTAGGKAQRVVQHFADATFQRTDLLLDSAGRPTTAFVLLGSGSEHDSLLRMDYAYDAQTGLLAEVRHTRHNPQARRNDPRWLTFQRVVFLRVAGDVSATEIYPTSTTNPQGFLAQRTEYFEPDAGTNAWRLMGFPPQLDELPQRTPGRFSTTTFEQHTITEEFSTRRTYDAAGNLLKLEVRRNGERIADYKFSWRCPQ